MSKILQNAITHFNNDKVLSKVVHNISLKLPKGDGLVYESLLRSIVSQQLSTKAAATIYDRFINHFDGDAHAENVFKTDIPTLRSLGLSLQKSSYVRNVAEHFLTNDIEHATWKNKTDEEIINELTNIKGVGKWTVQMVLMFHLNRHDVLPIDDLIIRNSMIRLYKIKEVGKAQNEKLFTIAKKWQPFRSIACRYLWAAKDIL